MTDDTDQFPALNTAFNRTFKPGALSIGLVVPIERRLHSPVPTLHQHVERVQLAESLGFAAVWLRDVPFNVPSFGDAGQTYDPFVYLGYLAAQTRQIALGVASIILPLRHPAHVAKAAASVDELSKGRLLLGIASGDRPEEYPALNVPFEARSKRFRESYDYIRHMAENVPEFSNAFGDVGQSIDMLPKPVAARIPLLITGGSQQSPDWIAEHGDGWMTYPRDVNTQHRIVGEWRDRVSRAGRLPLPVMQPLYVDLVDNNAEPPRPIHLGFRSGIDAVKSYLQSLRAIGINHVALNLRFNHADIETTLQRLAAELFAEFH